MGKVLKALYNLHYRTSTVKVYNITNNLQLEELIFLNNTIYIHEINHGRKKSNYKPVRNRDLHSHNTKTENHLHGNIIRTNKVPYNDQKIKDYNKLPSEVLQ